MLLGNGDGTFQPPGRRSPRGSGPSASVAVADVNGDGRPDLVVANSNNSTVSVLLNTGGATPLLSFVTSNGVLTATANGNNPDDVEVSRAGGLLTISDSGVSQTFPTAGLTQINIDTGAGNDVVRIDPGVGLPVSVNGGAGRDTLETFDDHATLAGGRGYDGLATHGSGDLLVGGRGNDTLAGGTSTTDTLRGGAGDDSLTGGGLLLGGVGNDTLVHAAAPSRPAAARRPNRSATGARDAGCELSSLPAADLIDARRKRRAHP